MYVGSSCFQLAVNRSVGAVCSFVEFVTDTADIQLNCAVCVHVSIADCWLSSL